MKTKKQYIVELAKTLSGHWYHVWLKKTNGSKGKLIGTFPSSTTILLAYPQSVQLTKWIADNGWQESQQIKEEAGIAGTRIHQACDYLEEGLELSEEDYSLKEWVKIKSFVDWHNEYKPVLVAKEMAIVSIKGKYAGRLDRIYNIKGETVILDFKSSSSIHEHFPLQFASYAVAVEENTDIKVDKTACLHLGASNKNGYRYVEYPDWKDHYKVFESVRSVWQYQFSDSKKTAKEAPVLVLPSTLKLS